MRVQNSNILHAHFRAINIRFKVRYKFPSSLMAEFYSIQLLTRTHKFIYIYIHIYKAFSVYIQSDLNPMFIIFISSHATVQLLKQPLHELTSSSRLTL
jgi:hypothetical protein